jgi:type IV pilus assembly protein PilC
LQVLVIREPGVAKRKFFSRRISVSDKANFARFMATMIRSGMSVPESADIIAKETKNKRLKQILADISYQTEKGQTISSVLSQYKNDFDSIFLTIIRSGEESGTLEKSFDYLSTQLMASYELSQKVKGSLMYPAVIIVAMFGNALIMSVFVLPRIAGAFLKTRPPSSGIHQNSLTFRQFMGQHTIYVLIASGILFAHMVFSVSISGTRNKILSAAVELRNRKNARANRYSPLQPHLFNSPKSAVPITTALDVSADSRLVRNTKKKPKLLTARFKRHVPFRHPNQKKGIFPSTMIQTIELEKIRKSRKVLDELASFYEKG